MISVKEQDVYFFQNIDGAMAIAPPRMMPDKTLSQNGCRLRTGLNTVPSPLVGEGSAGRSSSAVG
ncbi:hypothetical protein HL667_24035 [Bradyrhizobium sp. 83012]|uniref:Uncharacterized protein n=1 Tax=Bradyrhizobium aeschynomenes TaxID=2734909 RepID=A0ABX2CIT1_9BRAD|nr:hypothetical protein [Bradyrhizobium aeschynomenes]NPU11004.1 hypothetical protein [Bradyrhizobium aeschynomenes]NPU68093.1 hypothetical protein [Bradyrhizobium aeschynomenes]